MANSHVSVEMIEIQDRAHRLLPSGHLIINPVKVADGSRRRSIVSVEHAGSDARSSHEKTERELPQPKSVSVDLVLGSSAIARYRRRNWPEEAATAFKCRDHEPVELTLSVYLAGEDGPNSLPRAQRRSRKRDSVALAMHSVQQRTVVLPKFAMFVPESLIEPNACRRPSKPLIRKTFVLPERANKLRVGVAREHRKLCGPLNGTQND